MDIITGKRTIIEALHSGILINEIYIQDNMKQKEGFIREIKNILKKSNIPLKSLSSYELRHLSKTEKHGGAAAKVEEKRFVDVEQIFQNAEQKQEKPFIILLNGIEDPHNFGAILRSADGAGAHGIIIPKRRTAPIGATTARTSAGGLYHIPIAKVANISQTIMKLKEKGVWIVGSDSSSDTMYYDVDFTMPIAVIIGNEGKGMQDIVRKKCDFIVKIPMIGNVKSLNASVSGGVLFYEAVRQRFRKI